MDDFLLIDQAEDPVKMLFVDDLSVIGIVERLFPILSADLFLNFFDQLIFHRAVAVHIVRSHAGLPAVQVFPEDDPFCRKLDIRSLVHDAGTLSAKLQGDRREIFGGVPHDFLSHVLAAGEEDVVKMLVQKAGVLRASAGHHSYILGLEALGKDKPEHLACVGRISAGLYDRCISRGKRVDKRGEGQHEWIVPRAHDERHAVGRRFLIAAGMELSQRRAHPLLPCEFRRVLQHVADLL